MTKSSTIKKLAELEYFLQAGAQVAAELRKALPQGERRTILSSTGKGGVDYKKLKKKRIKTLTKSA